MYEVLMYRDDDTPVHLHDLLGVVPANEWMWSVFEFDGVGRMPGNYSVVEFREKVHEHPLGLIMTWPEILEFAAAVEYTIDCLIVAISNLDRLDANKLLADDFQECEIVLRAIDSTEWILFASKKMTLDALGSVARGS